MNYLLIEEAGRKHKTNVLYSKKTVKALNCSKINIECNVNE